MKGKRIELLRFFIDAFRTQTKEKETLNITSIACMSFRQNELIDWHALNE